MLVAPPEQVSHNRSLASSAIDRALPLDAWSSHLAPAAAPLAKRQLERDCPVGDKGAARHSEWSAPGTGSAVVGDVGVSCLQLGRLGDHELARADYRERGKGIARPEQQREPKQSWRAEAPHAWMSAIATARQVCWAADSEQAQSRLAWARAGPRDRCDLDHPVVAWPGVAVISSLPAHALLLIVRTSYALQRITGVMRCVRLCAAGGVERVFLLLRAI